MIRSRISIELDKVGNRRREGHDHNLSDVVKVILPITHRGLANPSLVMIILFHFKRDFMVTPLSSNPSMYDNTNSAELGHYQNFHIWGKIHILVLFTAYLYKMPMRVTAILLDKVIGFQTLNNAVIIGNRIEVGGLIGLER